MPLADLRAYRPQVEEPTDFDAFWAETLEEAARAGGDVVAEPYDGGLRAVEVRDVTFPGWGGQPVKAWLLLPRDRSGPLPAVVEYLGYGGGRALPWHWLTWSVAGYAHLVMDTRGQGGSGSHAAHTPDIAPDGHGSSGPGFLTRGIEDPRKHYYRRLITDAVRAVDAVQTFAEVDPSRVAVAGTSQGGGLALAVAGLRDDVGALLADVPFLCHVRRAVQITDAAPYSEVATWLRGHHTEEQRAFRTLSYLDGVNFAARAHCPAWFTTALMDVVCPPSTVFAAANRYAGPSDVQVFTYNGHEGGGLTDLPRKIEVLHTAFTPPAGAPCTGRPPPVPARPPRASHPCAALVRPSVGPAGLEPATSAV
ncbi:acetylxylan esterase [Cellulomonas endometrii]|uniref:acetylxylan esterase n=1 Tax=Cellulomonas endometrii TaxID=3036301 RepID=UPI0031F899EE